MSDKSDFDKVICPDCCHQFCAVPENVQNALRAAEAQAAALREALAKIAGMNELGVTNYDRGRQQWDFQAIARAALATGGNDE